MRIHLTQICVAVALAVAGFNSPLAVGQDAAAGAAAPYADTGYGYSAAFPAGGYAPYASTGYDAPTTPIQPITQNAYPTTPQQPFYVAMQTDSGVVKSPATPPPAATPAPTPQPAPSTGASCDNGMMSAGCDCYGGEDYGLGGYVESVYKPRQWFCGIYGLAMDRDEPGNARVGLLVSQADVTAAGSYVPVPSDTVLHANNAGYEYRGGVELRFGSTFNCGSTCEYGGCCPPRSYAWEFGYWWLAEDPSSATVVNGDPEGDPRLYSGVNFSGLNIPGFDSVNYVIPIGDTDIPIGVGDQRILAERVRTNFSAQNFELNILRLPFFSSGPACGSGCCEGTSCGSSFSMAGMCGVRYMRLDDNFQYGMEWGVWDGACARSPVVQRV